MSDRYERPSWAYSEETEDGGATVFRDAQGHRLLVLALTEQERALVQRALVELPQDEHVRALRERLDEL